MISQIGLVLQESVARYVKCQKSLGILNVAQTSSKIPFTPNTQYIRPENLQTNIHPEQLQARLSWIFCIYTSYFRHKQYTLTFSQHLDLNTEYILKNLEQNASRHREEELPRHSIFAHTKTNYTYLKWTLKIVIIAPSKDVHGGRRGLGLWKEDRNRCQHVWS